MSETTGSTPSAAERLRERLGAILLESNHGGMVARALVDELGISWEMVEKLHFGVNINLPGEEWADHLHTFVSGIETLLATILEAAGVERSE